MQKKKVVALGGGTGSFLLCSGLKQYADSIDISMIVGVSDSGGSGGKLRDEFGRLPMGDLRMALVALADESLIDSASLRELFLYRFLKGGEGLQGHNFGNLFLTALSDVAGSEKEAIAIVSRMLGVKGKVLPVAYEDITLVAEYSDGIVVRGETHIDEPTPDRDLYRIVDFKNDPHVAESREVRDALLSADMIILGPGDLFTSLLATCVVGEVPKLLRESPAPFVYVGNLVSKFGQTTGYDTATYVAELVKYIGRAPDAFFINTTPLPEVLIEKYRITGESPVIDTGSGNEESVCFRDDYLASVEVVTQAGDVLKRSLIRHDAAKLSRALMTYLETHPRKSA